VIDKTGFWPYNQRANQPVEGNMKISLFRLTPQSSLLTLLFFSLAPLLLCSPAAVHAGWFSQQPPAPPQYEPLNAVYFINSDTGYVVGDYGTILKTT